MSKSPPLLLTLLMVFLVGVFLALGKWQIDRKQEKTALLENQLARSQQNTVSLLAISPPYEKWRYHRVRFVGKAIAGRQALLDNQTHRGRVGYNVLTPFIPLSAPDKIVLVDRGWVERGMTRDDIPNIAIDQDAREIQGSVYVPLGKAFSLGEIVEKENTWPVVIQHLDFAALQQVFGKNLLPFSVRLSPRVPGEYLRKWKVVAGAPEKHLAYSAMFFAFAMLTLIFYVAVMCRIRAKVFKER